MNSHIMQSSSRVAWLILTALAFVWGSSFILIKKGLVAFSPGQVGSLRIFFAFIILLPVALKYFKGVQKKDWPVLFAVGFIGNLIPAYLFAIAETNLASSVTGILNSLTPISTLVFSVFIFKNKLKLWQILGLLIGLIGSVGITFVNTEGSLGEMNFYALYVVLATIFYGISVNLTKSFLGHLRPVIITSLALSSVGPLALGHLLTTDFFTRIATLESALPSLGYIFLLGFAGTAMALIFFNKLIHLTSAVFASSVTYLIPIVAVIWGFLDGEAFYPLHFVGMALIIFGVYKVNKS